MSIQLHTSWILSIKCTRKSTTFILSIFKHCEIRPQENSRRPANVDRIESHHISSQTHTLCLFRSSFHTKCRQARKSRAHRISRHPQHIQYWREMHREHIILSSANSSSSFACVHCERVDWVGRHWKTNGSGNRRWATCRCRFAISICYTCVGRCVPLVHRKSVCANRKHIKWVGDPAGHPPSVRFRSDRTKRRRRFARIGFTSAPVVPYSKSGLCRLVYIQYICIHEPAERRKRQTANDARCVERQRRRKWSKWNQSKWTSRINREHFVN